MTLKELKIPYEKNFQADLEDYNDTELVDMYLSTNSSSVKNSILSTLVCHSWDILQRMYFKHKENLSVEDCYDIYIQTLQYVVESHAWDNPENSLHNDPQAFIKAMAIALEGRRKNFLKAKFRDKRILNVGSLSLDGLEEDFSDGYFSYEAPQESLSKTDSLIDKRIKYYAAHKLYLTALILESIMYYNCYDSDGNFDIRKLRKHLRNLNDIFKKYFANKYSCDLDDLIKSTQYKDMEFEQLDSKIKTSFTTLKHDNIIKQILDK